MSAVLAPSLPAPSTGCRLVSTDGRTLPFAGGTLDVSARGGLAHVVLRQTFFNPHDEPLRVTYKVPLPPDAATAAFAFTLDGRRIVGRVKGRSEARKSFERAMLEGRTAALLEEERSSVFTQQVGNIPPGAEVVCELALDQLLVWARGGWEWRFPTVVAPRFLGAEGRVADAPKVAVDVASGPIAARMGLSLTVRDAVTGDVSSPSHTLHTAGDAFTLGEGVPLDRDVVVRWPVASPSPGATLDVARPAREGRPDAAYGLLTLVPPTVPGASPDRDLVVLLDTSGSMGGRPLDQAKAVVGALLDTLKPTDTLQMVEFSNRPRSWRRHPAAATRLNLTEARTWLAGLRASGGTQMRDGILAALKTVRPETRRQVILVTDGLIGFEHEITEAIRSELPAGCRVHTLGIGSSTNRTLLRGAAWAGGGVEAIIGLDEDPTEAADALVAATNAPQVVELQVTGDAVVETARGRLPDLMGGRPARVSVALKARGGLLTVTGRTVEGTWSRSISVPATEPGHGDGAVARRFARDRVDELEVEHPHGGADERIEAEGVWFQIATRRTSWIAEDDHVSVDPGAPTRTEEVPQELPYGMSAQGLGLRAGGMPAFGAAAPAGMPVAGAMRPPTMRRRRAMAKPASPPSPQPLGGGGFADLDDEVDALAEEGFAGLSIGGAPEPEVEKSEVAPPAQRSGGLPTFRRREAPVRAKRSHRRPSIGERLRGLFRLPIPNAALTYADGDTLVFTLTPTKKVAWKRPTRVRLLIDGVEVEVQVEAGTTGDGSVATSASIRLVIGVALGEAKIRRIRAVVFLMDGVERTLSVVDARG